MTQTLFSRFFTGRARDFLIRGIDLALEEDGRDLASRALFAPEDMAEAGIVAKGEYVLSGGPLIPLILSRTAALEGRRDPCRCEMNLEDGRRTANGQTVAHISGPALILLKAERVLLNYLSHLSGIASLTAAYVAAMGGAATRLLDTRKTLPGLRYPEKYAVLCGGGENHRLTLEDMFMLKDTHLDRAGGVAAAAKALRDKAPSGVPVEIECRDLNEVRQAVREKPRRIMFDNMDAGGIRAALALVPVGIETEISGGVSLENIAELAALGVTFISAGRLTHSAPAADFSLRLSGTTS